MKNLDLKDVQNYVKSHIKEFHDKRIDSLDKLKLTDVLKRKNPYLYKAKNQETASEIVGSIVSAFLSSNEETLFGDWLEKLAIFINGKVYGGEKSASQGIDLDFTDDDGVRFLVSIKSGPHWGNSSQIKKMEQDFTAAKQRIRQNDKKINIIAVNGCCYGKTTKPDKGNYYKLCGQEFWKLISGDPSLYLKIIKPLGYQAKAKNTAFQKAYNKKMNLFLKDFTSNYCTEKGAVDWDKIVKLCSEKK